MNRLVASSIAYEYTHQCQSEGIRPCREFADAM